MQPDEHGFALQLNLSMRLSVISICSDRILVVMTVPIKRPGRLVQAACGPSPGFPDVSDVALLAQTLSNYHMKAALCQ